MTPEEQALLEQIYQATQGSYEARRRRFLAMQEENPSLRGVALTDFAHFVAIRLETEARQKAMIPPPTAEKLWKAIREWEPHPLWWWSTTKLDRIYDLIDSRRFGPIPLGKLNHQRGVYPCALLPMGNALNPGEEAHIPDLRLHHNSRELAISYSDGYPLEEHASPKGVFNADYDSVLRRFITLGHIMMLHMNTWEKTGHVLVLDADSGRRSHPWIVLASEFRIQDDAAAVLGLETWITVPPSIGPNVTDTPGVLPGDRNRTPIAKILSCDDSIRLTGGKIVEHFGPDFSFYLNRVGKQRLGKSAESPGGPSRAETMVWYWDPIKEEEVCYTSTGQMRYRYDPPTREYKGAYPIPSVQ